MKKHVNVFRARSVVHVSKLGLLLVAAALLLPLQVTLPLQLANAADFSINVWWPTDGAHLSGLQPFKAMINGVPTDQYDLSWQVDGGQQNVMANNAQDYLHKEASVDVSTWQWHGTGPYAITFTAT